MNQQMPQGQPSQPVETPKSGGSMKWLLIILAVLIIGFLIYWLVGR